MIATVIGLLSVVQSVHAENLESAWREALGSDPIIESYRNRVSAAQATVGAAKGMRLPSVSANAGITRFDVAPAFDFSGAGVPAELPLFGEESTTMADAKIILPLYTGGMVTRGIDSAAASLDSAQHKVAVSVQQVKLEVAKNFINVLRAESALAVADSNTKSLEAHVRDAENMLRSGAVARNDYLAAAVSLADAQQRRLQAGNRLDLSHAAYNRALGRALNTPVMLDDELPGIDPSLDLMSLEKLTEVALRRRDELGSLEAAADAMRHQAESTRANMRPHLAVSGRYFALENDFLNRDQFWMVGVGVRWNLFDGGQTRRKASALSSRANAVAREREHLHSLIELRVHESWLRLNETEMRMRLTESAVEQADENLRVVRDRYRNGEGTNTEVLDAETLRNISRSNYDNAKFDAKLALYQLAREVGSL